MSQKDPISLNGASTFFPGRKYSSMVSTVKATGLIGWALGPPAPPPAFAAAAVAAADAARVHAAAQAVVARRVAFLDAVHAAQDDESNGSIDDGMSSDISWAPRAPESPLFAQQREWWESDESGGESPLFAPRGAAMADDGEESPF